MPSSPSGVADVPFNISKSLNSERNEPNSRDGPVRNRALSPSARDTQPRPSGASGAPGPTLISAIQSPMGIVREAFGPEANLYGDVLKIHLKATDHEIRKAYFRRGREVLGNVGVAAALSEEKKSEISDKGKLQFQAVSVAYEILSDPCLRREYDQTGDVRKKSNEVAECVRGERIRNSSLLRGKQTQQSEKNSVTWNDHVEELTYQPSVETDVSSYSSYSSSDESESCPLLKHEDTMKGGKNLFLEEEDHAGPVMNKTNGEGTHTRFSSVPASSEDSLLSSIGSEEFACFDVQEILKRMKANQDTGSKEFACFDVQDVLKRVNANQCTGTEEDVPDDERIADRISKAFKQNAEIFSQGCASNVVCSDMVEKKAKDDKNLEQNVAYSEDKVGAAATADTMNTFYICLSAYIKSCTDEMNQLKERMGVAFSGMDCSGMSPSEVAGSFSLRDTELDSLMAVLQQEIERTPVRGYFDLQSK